MFETIKKQILKSIFLIKKNRTPWPEGKEGLKVRSHRQMVGGMWDEIGQFQFEYIKSQGLKTEDVLLDIGCGCFRGGRWFIDYLESGNYLGIDKQSELIEQGKKEEIRNEIWIQKKPEVIVSDKFEFSRLHKKPKFAIAQSLFTHLSSKDIKKCLKNLAEFVPNDCKLYATFFETEIKVANVLSSHSSRRFEYTASEMASFGKATGWKMEHVGDWNHPRNQKLVVYYRK